jgi:hypothetical protein
MCYNAKTGALNRRRRAKASKVFSGGLPESLSIRHADFKLHFPLIFFISVADDSIIVVVEPCGRGFIDVIEGANALEVFHHLTDNLAVLVYDNINSAEAVESVRSFIGNVFTTLGELLEIILDFFLCLASVIASDSAFFSHHF